MADALRFRKLQLQNWKNFGQVEVALQRRVFLVGPNAAGKSNFLDVFRFLRDLATGGGLQDAVARRGGVSAIRYLGARRHPDIRIYVEIGDGEPDATWTYELVFHQDNQRRPLVRKEVVRDREGRVLLERPEAEEKEDAELLTQTALEQVHKSRQFRDLVRFLQSVQYLHIVPQLIREPDRSVGRVNDPFGGDFLEQVAKVNQRTRDAWLRRIQEALKVVVPRLEEIEFVRNERTGVPHLRGRYSHWRKRGAWQTEEQFSDGTLRLVGLFWAVLQKGGPLLLEEPELSLHPAIVRVFPRMLASLQDRTGRQVILSTHSPDLLADEGIGLDEIVLLVPEDVGTVVQTAASLQDAEGLLRAGIPLPEIVMEETAPRDPDRILRTFRR